MMTKRNRLAIAGMKYISAVDCGAAVARANLWSNNPQILKIVSRLLRMVMEENQMIEPPMAI
jgi:hypothetical protein